MADWTSLTGMQMNIVKEALLSAFPQRQDFETFLYLYVNQRWPRLVREGANYENGLVDLLMQADAGGWLGQLVRAAQQRVPGNPKLRTIRHLRDLTTASSPAGRSLEDIVRNDGGFTDVIPWIRQLDRLTKQICRIEYPINQGIGTGWLVAKDLVLTNWHVIARALAGERKAQQYVCRFDYATDNAGTNTGVTVGLANDWCINSSPASSLELGTGNDGPTAEQLDHALLRLAEPIGEKLDASVQQRGWIRTAQGTPAPAQDSIVFVLQHPSGDPQKLAIGNALGTNGNGTRLKHNANTSPGSSGSPCLNAKLELIGLHNSGDPIYNGVTGAPTENHAVPIDSILAILASAGVPKFWN